MRAFPIAALLACAVACGPRDGDEPEPTPDLVMADANTYAYSGHMTLGVTELAAQTNVSFDWCDLTTDIRGRPVDPDLVDRLLLVEIDATQAEVVTKIETNALTMADTVAPWMYQNEDARGCTASLDDFEIAANPFQLDSFAPSDHTWLLSATYYEAGIFDFLMPSFVVPTAGSPSHTATLLPTTSRLDVDVDLHTLEPMRTAAGFDAFTFDWSAVTADVYGNPFDDQRADRVLIGKLPFDSLSQAEAAFLRLDTEAEELYRLHLVDGIPVVQGETSADLMLATDAQGHAFPGFTPDGTWLLGVECTTCSSPAPLVLGVVEVDR